jgi:hypothetical protein
MSQLIYCNILTWLFCSMVYLLMSQLSLDYMLSEIFLQV